MAARVNDDDSGDARLPARASGRRCRSMAGLAINQFLDLLERNSAGTSVDFAQARALAARLEAESGPTPLWARTEGDCHAAFTMANVERMRHNHLGRVVVRHFAHLLDQPSGGLHRAHLQRLFAALRMMLGDEAHAELQAQCAEVAESHRGPDGMVRWEAFHADDRARAVYDRVLVTIAHSFRRFDPRTEWFLIMMNSAPSVVSQNSKAYLARRVEDKPTRPFTEADMLQLFRALFAGMRAEGIDHARLAPYAAPFCTTPEALIEPLFVALDAMALRV